MIWEGIDLASGKWWYWSLGLEKLRFVVVVVVVDLDVWFGVGVGVRRWEFRHGSRVREESASGTPFAYIVKEVDIHGVWEVWEGGREKLGFGGLGKFLEE